MNNPTKLPLNRFNALERNLVRPVANQHLRQSFILLFGGLAILLISLGGECEKWGFLSGLISEPVWMYDAWKNRQWGVVIMAVWWGFFYAYGLAVRL